MELSKREALLSTLQEYSKIFNGDKTSIVNMYKYCPLHFYTLLGILPANLV